MSPHSPSPTASFFVLKSKTLWKRCLYLLSLLSHLFPLCIITISVIVIIVVTKSVLLFWSQGCKGLSYSYCSACEYHLHCGQGPFMLYFALHPSSLLSTLLSLSTTCTHKFVLLEYLNVHYFLKTLKTDFLLSVFSHLLMFSKMEGFKNCFLSSWCSLLWPWC